MRIPDGDRRSRGNTWRNARVVLSGHAGDLFGRRLLPIALILPLILGWLGFELQRAGVTGIGFAVALSMLLNIAIFVAVTRWRVKSLHTADTRSRQLDLAVAKREQRESWFGGLLESTPDAMLIVGQDGRIIRVNQQSEMLFGYAREELVGRPVEILVPERFRARHPEYRATFTGAPKTRPMGASLDLLAVRKDGTEIPVELSLASLQSEQGLLVVTAIRDVSERRRQAGELRAAKEAAEEARAKAERASRAKSAFLASISHELRTPLNAISGYAQLLHSSGGTIARDRQIEYAQSIEAASTQLLGIINDVLDLARIEAEQISLNCEVADCLEIMTEVSRTLDIMAKQRGIMLTCDTSANLPSIRADRARLIQVLLNLGSNAIKYNIEDGWVVMSALPYGDMVRFLVRDTGRGIPAERHDQVFQPFNRLGAELGSEDGTGIGLTISRRLVHAMGGRIGFESIEGQGSTFWIELPVANDITATTIRAPTPLSSKATNYSHTVLYVEDKILNIELMHSIMEQHGDIRVLSAQTVAEGVGIARSAKPDLVITDIHLPDGTGFDVLNQLRGDPQTAHIPVIALTADAMPINMANMQRAEFDVIMTKPFEISELLGILQTHLKAA